MSSRAEEATFGVRPSRLKARREAVGALSGTQRLLFVLALFTFGLSSIYTSVALLSRVTPALFPGRSLVDGLNGLPLGNLVTKLPVSSPGQDSAFNQRINLLIMGIDRRPLPGPQANYSDVVRWGGNTDTLIVATIDPLAKTVSLLSFPRDMWIDIHPPGGGVFQQRINYSFDMGLNAGKTVDAGAKQLETDMKADFGININYYVTLDFTGVEKLVDVIGGVDVNVPPDLAVYNWFYSDDDIHGQYVNFPPGPQHLDGYHAVAFGRNRNPTDFARIKRQQLVIEAAMKKIFSLNLLANPLDLWNAYGDTIHTDVPVGKMPGYALLLKETQGKPMNTFSLGDPVNGVPTMLPFTTDAGAAVLHWNPQNVQYWLAQTFTKAEYSASTVEIRNGAGPTGSADTSALGHYLAYSKGLPTVYYGPDQPLQPTSTITLYGTAKQQLANDMAGWLGIDPATIITQPRNNDPTLPDVMVVVGQDFKIPGN